jgi:hypothetical protein
MVLRTATRGAYAGQPFWGCSTYPKCRSVMGLAPQSDSAAPTHNHRREAAAGASAQAQFDRRERRRTERIRRRWPLAVGIIVVITLVIYLLIASVFDARFGALAAAAAALSLLVAYLERPQTIEAWRTGAAGERRTARYLGGLAESGFVVLHDRKVPGYGGNLDHILIGPTGVWAVETKSIAGKVVIDGDSLWIAGRRQDRIIDQVYREAAAIQVALAMQLPDMTIRVTPIVCLHRGELPFFNKTVRGVRLTSGRQLVRLVGSGDRRLGDDEVQRVAAVATRMFKAASA